MAFGLLLTIHEPPLDGAALQSFLAQLPLLPADRLRIRLDPPQVEIAFRGSDTRCGHGAAIGTWILARYRCSGEDLDWGTLLPNNAACAAHLARVSGVIPTNPGRLHAALHPRLLGAWLQRIQVDRWSVILDWGAGPTDTPCGRLWLARAHATLDLQSWPDLPDVAVGSTLEALCDLLDRGDLPLVSLQATWRTALTWGWEDGRRLCLDAAADAPTGEPLWSISTPDDILLVIAFVGEGPVWVAPAAP